MPPPTVAARGDVTSSAPCSLSYTIGTKCAAGDTVILYGANEGYGTDLLRKHHSEQCEQAPEFKDYSHSVYDLGPREFHEGHPCGYG